MARSTPFYHPFDPPPQEAVRLQEELSQRLILRWDGREVRRVAGMDAAYIGGKGIGVVVVMGWPGLEVLEEVWAVAEVRYPYIPGLLSFREIPLLLEAFRRVRSSVDLILVDGQGIAHPRRMGLAAHIGLLLDMPTVGCAKKPLVGEAAEPPDEKGAISPLLYRGEQVGVMLRTRKGVKPVVVSPGHRMEVDRAWHFVLLAARRFRLPEPTRRAHLLAQRIKRSLSSP